MARVTDLGWTLIKCEIFSSLIRSGDTETVNKLPVTCNLGRFDRTP